MTSSLQQGIDAAKSGMMEQALVHLKDAIVEEPENANVWVWLSAIIEDEEKQVIFLKKRLKLTPPTALPSVGWHSLNAKNTSRPSLVRSFQITPSPSAYSRPHPRQPQTLPLPPTRTDLHLKSHMSESVPNLFPPPKMPPRQSDAAHGWTSCYTVSP